MWQDWDGKFIHRSPGWGWGCNRHCRTGIVIGIQAPEHSLACCWYVSEAWRGAACCRRGIQLSLDSKQTLHVSILVTFNKVTRIKSGAELQTELFYCLVRSSVTWSANKSVVSFQWLQLSPGCIMLKVRYLDTCSLFLTFWHANWPFNRRIHEGI